MKTHLRVAIIMTMISIGASWSFGSSEAAGADWKSLQQSTYGDSFSYDAASVKRTEKNTTTVLTKTQSGQYLYEMDCKTKKARLLEGAGDAQSGWFNITGGEDELLYKAVCP